MGQDGKKYPLAARSKSEPRHGFGDLYDENMLGEQKRDMMKKILRLQRQKLKDNQARKARTSNEFENSLYSFGNANAGLKNNDDAQSVLNE